MKLAHIAAVPAGGAGPANDERIRFCSHCGTLFEGEPTSEHPYRDRVCTRCGLGMVLGCDPDLLDRDRQAFLVVTGDLRISAASEAATELLAGAGELTGRPLLELLDPPALDSELVRRVARAAGGSGDISLLRMEALGRTFCVKVGRCGDPRAAIVVFDP